MNRACVCLLLQIGVVSGCASNGSPMRESSSTPVRALPADTLPVPAVDAMPAGFTDAFRAVDARARAALFQIQCSSTVLRLRASGSFGAATSAPRNVYCERNADGIPLGGVFDIDTGYTRARRLMMIRLDGARPRYVSPIDTVRVAQGARLVRDVTREVSPAWRRLARPFTVVALPQEDGSIEGWVIPVSPRSGREVLGGDVAMIHAANGRLQRTVDRAASWKLVVVPATGTARLASAERDIAAVADLVVARSLAERGRMVIVTTSIALSALVPGVDASGSRYHWEHVPVKP